MSTVALISLYGELPTVLRCSFSLVLFVYFCSSDFRLLYVALCFVASVVAAVDRAQWPDSVAAAAARPIFDDDIKVSCTN